MTFIQQFASSLSLCESWIVKQNQNALVLSNTWFLEIWNRFSISNPTFDQFNSSLMNKNINSHVTCVFDDDDVTHVFSLPACLLCLRQWFSPGRGSAGRLSAVCCNSCVLSETPTIPPALLVQPILRERCAHEHPDEPEMCVWDWFEHTCAVDLIQESAVFHSCWEWKRGCEGLKYSKFNGRECCLTTCQNKNFIKTMACDLGLCFHPCNIGSGVELTL